jgi:predicted O-methyltransferase YrrM
MSADTWSAVDQYISQLFVPEDPALAATLAASQAAGLPDIQVSPSQGKLLHLLARIQGARRILELGTLGGYSTIWLARALPADGQLITLESDPIHAGVARVNIARAGLDRLVELRLGPALETLPKLVTENRGPFDLIFLDADKDNYPAYLPWLLKLSRRGTILVADNLVRNGAVIDPASSDPRVQGVRRFNELLAAEPGTETTLLQTVGSKGYDGFALSVVGGAS